MQIQLQIAARVMTLLLLLLVGLEASSAELLLVRLLL
jgi:hypothetical protein